MPNNCQLSPPLAIARGENCQQFKPYTGGYTVKYLIEMDYQDTRKRYVVDEDYLNSLEFELFDGTIIDELKED